MQFECIEFIGVQVLTPAEARELRVQGYKLTKLGMCSLDADYYDVFKPVYAKGDHHGRRTNV